MIRIPALLPIGLALLLSACAGTGGTPETAGTADAPRTASSARSAPPAGTVNWNMLRTDLSTALRDVPGAEVSPAPEGLQLRLPATDGFAFGTARPHASLTRALDTVIAPLAAYPRVAIHVVGHTDSVGSEMYNLKLSIARAEAVMEYLRSRGLAFERLSADGKGEAEPIADNANESARARNRRVEFYLRAMP